MDISIRTQFKNKLSNQWVVVLLEKLSQLYNRAAKQVPRGVVCTGGLESECVPSVWSHRYIV